MTTPQSILIVDDEEVFRARLCKAFERRGFEVQSAGDYDQAVALASEESPEWALIDLRMKGPSGLELLQKLKSIDPTTRIVMLTGYGSIATAVEAMRLGASNYVSKPADVDDILAAFEKEDSPPLTPVDDAYRPLSLARVEWEHINKVLVDSGGNISEAARRLGMHRRTLQRKLEKYPPRS
jgi:two-component system response regulator RegA